MTTRNPFLSERDHGNQLALQEWQSLFQFKDLKVTRATGNELHSKPKKDDLLKFGHNYSDHMAFADWSESNGWTVPEITPLRNFSMHPGAKVIDIRFIPYHFIIMLSRFYFTTISIPALHYSEKQ